MKQMLRSAFELTPEYKSIGDRAAGIVFLSTPHNGASIASYINAIGRIATSDAIRELKDNGPTLRELGLWFRNKYMGNNALMMKVFFESLNTYGIRVVDEISANPFIPGLNPIPVDADHIDICKPPKIDVRVSQTLALINQVVSQQLDVGPDEKLSPLGRIIKAKDDEIPLLRAQLQNELERNPRDARIKAALSHLNALKFADIALSVEPRSTRLYHASSMLLAIALLTALVILGFEWKHFDFIYRFLEELIAKIF